jgi:predicted esterase
VLTLALTSLLAAAPLATPRAPIEDFCPRGFVALAGDGCLAAPEHFVPGHLILYFHGMLPPDLKSPRELSLLWREARARGYAVVALRGDAGLCPWGDFSAWSCFPSDRSQLPRVNKVLERLDAVLAVVKAQLKTPELGTPFVAGFSNGGYFSTMLLSDTRFEARAWAVLHAGGVTGQRFPPERRGPVLLVVATEDTEQAPGMRTLAATLREGGWPVTMGERDGAHEVREDDAQAVMDFFEAQRRQAVR